MFNRIFRGTIVGLFAAVGAYVLNADLITCFALLGVGIIVAMVDILATEVFTLMVVFAMGSLVWTYTPVGKYVLGEIQKKSGEVTAPKQGMDVPKKSD